MINKINTNNAKIKQDNGQKKQLIIWISAMLIGAILGCLGIAKLNNFFNFVATVFTKLFQFVAIPTIALAVITTLSELGAKKNAGKIFGHAAIYTVLTTFAAAIVSLMLYIIFTPQNIMLEAAGQTGTNIEGSISYYEHLLSIIPDNILKPLLSGNVLSVIIVAMAAGIGLSFTPETENKAVLIKLLYGLQELLFVIIRGLLFVLPIGIAAFCAQLCAQMTAGSVMGALGKYTAIVLGGNLIQMFVIIPVFLILRGLNPIHIFQKMSPALIVAFFTKSSAGTLPVTLTTAENNLKVNPSVSRFVLPICTTINMNGCAAFILVTSLFVMQNSGIELNLATMIIWLFISVFAAIGNAGVPMGCYFLTLSLMSQTGASLGLLGIYGFPFKTIFPPTYLSAP